MGVINQKRIFDMTSLRKTFSPLLKLLPALLLPLFSTFLTPAAGSGYLIPEASLRAMGKTSANYVGNDSADAAYYNPAFMDRLSDEGDWELGTLYIKLEGVSFRGTVSGAPASATSLSESKIVPFFHYVAPKRNEKTRFGLSLVAPAGLSKRWNTPFQMASAEEFSLEVIELKPSVSFRVSDRFSLAIGPRVIKSEGVVAITHPTGLYKSYLKGDSVDYGYSIHAAWAASEKVDFGLTWRSRVDLTMSGNARGSLATALGAYNFDTPATVDVVLPAVLDLGFAFRHGRNRWELVFERAMWSAYSSLDFNYNDPIVEKALGASRAKEWDDSTAIRFGLTRNVDEKLTLLAGLTWDGVAVPEKTIGFELPDSDAYAFSIGALYRYRPDMEAGFAYIYDRKKSRTVSGTINTNGIDGTFDGYNIHLLALSLRHHF